MENKILPIVVIYCCKLEESVAYQTFIVRNGIQAFVVYDNSPSSYQQDMSLIPSGAYYYRDMNNGGLSKAYNYGAETAEKYGYNWVLLLDQDTNFPQGSLEAYQQFLCKNSLLVPNVVLKNGGAFSPCIPMWTKRAPTHLDEGEYSLFSYNVINSGCCLPVDIFREAGGYKQDVRLDFSDFQFQRRLRKVKPLFYVIPLTAVQDFSNDETRPEKLIQRYLLYLDGALHCDGESFRERISRNILILKHTLALSVRTHSLKFIVCYLKKYLFQL